MQTDMCAQVLGYRGAPLRNCALIGMSAGLSAFFGVALGGARFSCLGKLLAPCQVCQAALPALSHPHLQHTLPQDVICKPKGCAWAART